MLHCRMLTCLLAFVAAAAAAGCMPSARSGDLYSDNPAPLLQAIHQAGKAGDTAAVPRLIELLDHDDDAIRMFSIQALERITGHEDRMGYDPYAPATKRRPAIRKWVEAANEGRLGALSTPVDPPGPEPDTLSD